MRKEVEVNNEIKKFRKLLNSKQFNEVQKAKAWVSLLTLQWAKTKGKDYPLTPLDFCEVHGPTYKQYLKR